MKLAVLFGSFNPMTDAHVKVMKTAVETLGADKGLFVATNGQYLLRKTVKIDDPFYLTEDERKYIIDSVCQTEPKLEFWGYESGGINPQRYKTLLKIQKQYPEAEIYEVQGADKVRSISKIAGSNNYVNDFKFVIFNRKDVDINQLLDSDSLLSEHKDHFVVLPAVDNFLSSTEVRRRFYKGEDFEGIPEAAVEVLKKHKPSDFTISYEDKMKTIIGSGRFGANRACQQVYAENTVIFNDWKKGTAEVDLGDYKAFLDNTTFYSKPYTVDHLGVRYPSTEIGCINADCMDLAQRLISEGYNPAILNLASAGRPGGGYDRGMHAQEESLCQSSNLSLSLYQFCNPKKAKCIRESGVPHKFAGYPLDTNFGGIYTPEVTFFRNNMSRYFTFKENSFKCDVITVAALSFNGRNDYARAFELSYRAADGTFNAEGEAVMLNKIRTIFRMGVEHGKDSLVLGAFGCGAYKLPVAEVVRLFDIVINEPEFKNKFRLITFAILESTHRPNGLNGKFAEFYNKFGTFR